MIVCCHNTIDIRDVDGIDGQSDSRQRPMQSLLVPVHGASARCLGAQPQFHLSVLSNYLAPSQCRWNVALVARLSHVVAGGYDINFFRPFTFHFLKCNWSNEQPRFSWNMWHISFSDSRTTFDFKNFEIREVPYCSCLKVVDGVCICSFERYC